MNEILENLTLSTIRALCTEASFSRGQSYYADGAVTQRLRVGETQLQAQVAGSSPYRVSVAVSPDGQLETRCTCPYDYGGDCKHIVAVLLAWLNEPDSFKPPVDLKMMLAKRRKSELMGLLLEALAIHPDLAIDLGLEEGEIISDDPESVVGDIFEEMEVYGRLTANQAAARLKRVADQAKQLAKQGQDDLARRTYYAMVINCVRLFGPYGHELISPYGIPYIFATAYVKLARKQLGQHRAAIEAEVKAIYAGDYADEMYDLMEALVELERALGWSVAR